MSGVLNSFQCQPLGVSIHSIKCGIYVDICDMSNSWCVSDTNLRVSIESIVLCNWTAGVCAALLVGDIVSTANTCAWHG